MWHKLFCIELSIEFSKVELSNLNYFSLVFEKNQNIR
jgi:hypothetical protein